jgi:hypothetical protein
LADYNTDRKDLFSAQSGNAYFKPRLPVVVKGMLPESQDQSIDREIGETDLIILFSDQGALVGSQLSDDPSVFVLRLRGVPLAQEYFATTSRCVTNRDACLTGRVTAVGRRCSFGGACHALNLVG